MIGPSYHNETRSGLTLIYAPTGKKRQPVEGVHLRLDTPLDQPAWSYTLDPYPIHDEEEKTLQYYLKILHGKTGTEPVDLDDWLAKHTPQGMLTPDELFLGSPVIDQSGSVIGILKGRDSLENPVNGTMSPIGVLNTLLTQGEVHRLKFPKDTP